jgi:hypothetical protein
MAALVDLWHEEKALAPQDRLVAGARFLLGTRYQHDAKDAKPLHGIHGNNPLSKIACSGFVRSDYEEVFPEAGLSARNDLNALKFMTAHIFVDVGEPQRA